MMEQVYCTAPKPFNRYPNGYRPMTDSLPRSIRPSNSWSSFPHNNSTDSLNLLSPPIPWNQERQRKRNTASFSYDPESPLAFSLNDNLSPFSTESNTQQPPPNRFTFSPSLESRYQSLDYRPTRNREGFSDQNNTSMPSYHDMYKPRYFGDELKLDEPPTYPIKRLTKTQSDFSNERRPFVISPPNNHTRHLGGFFNSGLAEPNWMTHPPPPKAFQNDVFASAADGFCQSSIQPRNVPSRSVQSSNYYPETINQRDEILPETRYHIERPSRSSYNQNPVPLPDYSNNSSDLRYSNFSQPIPLSHNRVLHILPNQESVDVKNGRSETPNNRSRLMSPYNELHIGIQQPRQQSPPKPLSTYQIFSPVESKVYNRSNPTVINGFKTVKSPEPRARSPTDTYRPLKKGPVPPVAVIEPNSFGTNTKGYYKEVSPAYHRTAPIKQTLSKLNPPALTSSWSPSSTYDNDSDFDLDDINRYDFASLPRTSHQSRSHVSNCQQNDALRDSLQGILVKRPNNYKSSKKVVFLDQNRGDNEAPPHVRAFDAAIEESLAKFSQLSDEIGGDVAVVKAKAVGIFDALRHFLWTAAGTVEPTQQGLFELFKPLVEQMEQLSQYKDSKRNTPMFNHLSAVSEGIPAVGWVSIKKTPAPYAKEMVDAAMYYVNRILREFKGSDPKQVDWANSWKELLEEMVKFVRQTHTTGLVWNSAPGNVPSGGKKATGGAPPPPPPPPPPADFLANIPPPAASGGGNSDKSNRDALFAALNKGEAITSGLKKVTADMQTHKNPGLRGTAPIPEKVKAGTMAAQQAAPVQRPPKLEIEDGKRWVIEYFKNDKNIVVNVTDKKQAIYVYKCENSVIRVNGKANSVTLDGCKKTSIVFDALVAQCETINCQSIQIQTLGEMPTISIQKTDGCQVYLSAAAQNAEIISSKSSEMNVLVQTSEEGDYVEYPIPEQFKSTYVGGKVVTTVSEIV